MPISTLDPVTALIVVDLQNGIAALPTAHSTADVIAKSAELAAAFRSRNLPVVMVTVEGSAPGRTQAPRRSPGQMPAGFADLVPELAGHASDHHVVKHTWGAFTGTGLAEHLKSLGVTETVLVGVATSIGVESTARQSSELGFNVALATDAMTDMDSAAHENSISKIFPRLGETGTTAEIIAALPELGE